MFHEENSISFLELEFFLVEYNKFHEEKYNFFVELFMLLHQPSHTYLNKNEIMGESFSFSVVMGICLPVFVAHFSEF